MSNKTKASPVKTITVSAEQFAQAVASIATNGASIMKDLTTACAYIAQATCKRDQDTRKKAVAVAYQNLQAKLTGKDFAIKSAQTWVQRSVKKLSGDTKFKWLESKTTAAAKKRAARAGGKQAAPAAAPAAPKATVTSIEKVRDALIAKEKKNLDDFINIIPSGKIKEFEQAYAAFIQTLEIILK
jgi:endonuclease I